MGVTVVHALLRRFCAPLSLAAASLLLGFVPQDAGAVVWTFDDANCVSTSGPSGNCGSGDGNFSDERTYQGSTGGNVTVSGWANTIGGNQQLQRGQISHFAGGLGVRNADAGSGDSNEESFPENGIDNDDRFDLVLLDFGNQSVQLTELTIGGFDQDADLSILAYIGALDPTDPTSFDYLGDREAWWNSTADNNEDLTANGWTVVGNHDVDSGPGVGNPQSVNSGNVASRYWLVSAYNPVFGNTCTPSNSFCQSDFEDYFFISSVTGNVVTPTSVPEPKTALMFAIGLVGFAGLNLAKRRSAHLPLPLAER